MRVTPLTGMQSCREGTPAQLQERLTWGEAGRVTTCWTSTPPFSAGSGTHSSKSVPRHSGRM